MDPLIAKWKASPNPPDTKEIARRLIDLLLVSVLLDACAGNAWTFKEEASGQSFSRSEGLGVASMAMFEQGLFSGDPANPHQADGMNSCSNDPPSPEADRYIQRRGSPRSLRRRWG